MSSEDDQQRREGPPDAAVRAGAAQPGISRRAALGRISAGAAVGTTAWVIPQILTAGATMSGSPATLAGTTGTPNFPVTAGAAPDGGAPSTLSNLATTGLDLERDAEIGAAISTPLHTCTAMPAASAA